MIDNLDKDTKQKCDETPQEGQDFSEDTVLENQDDNPELEEKVKELEKSLEERQKELEEYKNRWIRTYADLDNYRKRTQREIQDIYRYAGEELVKDILPVIDNFERALDLQEDKENPVLKGVELIYKQFKEVLEKHEVKEIEALGKPFDPNFHDAVMMVETDEYEENTIAEVLLKGYTYNTKVIRPSMVKVAKK